MLDFEPVLNKFVREHLPRINKHVLYHRQFVRQDNDQDPDGGAYFASASASCKNQGS